MQIWWIVSSPFKTINNRKEGMCDKIEWNVDFLLETIQNRNLERNFNEKNGDKIEIGFETQNCLHSKWISHLWKGLLLLKERKRIRSKNKGYV